MIKIEETVMPDMYQWMSVINATRNPLNSWDKSDSAFTTDWYYDKENILARDDEGYQGIVLGKNDRNLLMKLRNAGTDHRKFMRMIVVYANITAPLYWWKEMDTYRVGKEQNSCSTMHTIANKEFTLDDFSCEHLIKDPNTNTYFHCGGTGVPSIKFRADKYNTDPYELMEGIVDMLNKCREWYLETKDKKYWWQMIQLLPSSYNQKRTVMFSYETLANIYKSRKTHKLDEWVEFCNEWIRRLPFSELITGEENGSQN